MQDYNINVNYRKQSNNIQTSPKYKGITSDKTQAIKSANKGKSSPIGLRRVGTIALASAAKINSYVGALTENTVTQRKRQIGIMSAGFALAATVNPLFAMAAAGIFVGDRAIQYNIKQYKENLSAEFLRDLSGGTVSTRK